MISNALQEAMGSRGDITFWNCEDATKSCESKCWFSRVLFLKEQAKRDGPAIGAVRVWISNLLTVVM